MIDFPLETYEIIYADPPWQYKNYNYAKTKEGNRAKRGIVKEYPVMTVEDIQILPVQNISADHSFLFLWVTWPLLHEGLSVIESWGFTYKTVAFNWIKLNKKTQSLFWGMGNFTRSNSEVCLLGIKGKPKVQSHSVHSVIMEPVSYHSKKPDSIRSKIVELCGDVPRIELFARNYTENWDTWGNEI